MGPPWKLWCLRARAPTAIDSGINTNDESLSQVRDVSLQLTVSALRAESMGLRSGHLVRPHEPSITFSTTANAVVAKCDGYSCARRPCRAGRLLRRTAPPIASLRTSASPSLPCALVACLRNAIACRAADLTQAPRRSRRPAAAGRTAGARSPVRPCPHRRLVSCPTSKRRSRAAGGCAPTSPVASTSVSWPGGSAPPSPSSRRSSAASSCASKLDTLIMYELGLPLDAETKVWIEAARQARAASLVPPVAAGTEQARLHHARARSSSKCALRSHLRRSVRRSRRAWRRRRQGRATAPGGFAEDYEFFAAEDCACGESAARSRRSCSTGPSATSMRSSRRRRRATGKVRALVLKGRQQGCSTYVAGRFYHRASRERGLRVFILTHAGAGDPEPVRDRRALPRACARAPRPPASPTPTSCASTRSIPATRSAPPAPAASAAPRPCSSCTAPRWRSGPMRESHAAGVLQAVPDAPGTEIILESPPTGSATSFTRSGATPRAAPATTWRSSCPGTGRRNTASRCRRTSRSTPRSANTPRSTARPEQMAWRRAKIVELKDARLFKQEYPASAAEAFQMSGHDSFIPPALIAQGPQGAVRAVRPAGDRLRSGLDGRRPPRHGVAARAPPAQGGDAGSSSTPWRPPAGRSG